MDSPRIKDDLTAYPLSAKELKARLSNAFIDAEAFKQGLQHCSLSACHGMCCYDGVYVSHESASIISDLVKEESDFFRKIGLSLPEEVIVEGDVENVINVMGRPEQFAGEEPNEETWREVLAQ